VARRRLGRNESRRQCARGGRAPDLWRACSLVLSPRPFLRWVWFSSETFVGCSRVGIPSEADLLVHGFATRVGALVGCRSPFRASGFCEAPWSKEQKRVFLWPFRFDSNNRQQAAQRCFRVACPLLPPPPCSLRFDGGIGRACLSFFPAINENQYAGVLRGAREGACRYGLAGEMKEGASGVYL